jgi:hypothetical protein
MVPLDPTLVPRTSSPEALPVPPPWRVNVPVPPEPIRTAVPEVTAKLALESIVTETLLMSREPNARLPWLAALTTPPEAISYTAGAGTLMTSPKGRDQ